MHGRRVRYRLYETLTNVDPRVHPSGMQINHFRPAERVNLARAGRGGPFLSIVPTELRLLVIAGNIALLRQPYAMLAGKQYLLFDVGGAIGLAGMGVALVWSIVKHADQLYRDEPVT